MSTPYPLYKDFHKKATDFLTKDFPTTFKLELKQPRVTEYWGIEAVATEKDGSPITTITPKIHFKGLEPFTLGFTADTKRNFKVEGVYDEKKNGLKATLTGFSENNVITIGAEHKHRLASSDFLLTLNSPKGILFNFATVAGRDNLALGIQTEVNLSTKAVTDLNASASYAPKSKAYFDLIGIYAKFKKNVAGFRAVYPVPDTKLTIISEVEFNYKDTTEGPRFAVGGSYDVEKNGLPTSTVVKGKVESNGTVSAAVSTVYNAIKVTIGASFNTNNPSAKPTYGLNLLIE